MALKIGKYYITRNNPRKLLKENKDLIDKLEQNTKIYQNTRRYTSEIEGKYVIAQAKIDKVKALLKAFAYNQAMITALEILEGDSDED